MSDSTYLINWLNKKKKKTFDCGRSCGVPWKPHINDLPLREEVLLDSPTHQHKAKSEEQLILHGLSKGKDVGFLGLCMNVVDSDSSSNVRHEVVVLQGNVLCSWSEVMASSHCNARLIVFPYLAVKVWFVDVESVRWCTDLGQQMSGFALSMERWRKEGLWKDEESTSTEDELDWSCRSLCISRMDTGRRI